MIRNSIKKLINKFGYDLHRIVPSTAIKTKTRTTIAESYSHLKALGFDPVAVIDVGVATGTPELYSAFPSAYLLLIEPLTQFEEDLRIILQSHHGSYVLAAAGARSGTVIFNLHQDHPHGSSLYKESMGSTADGHEVIVPLIRIDDIIKEKHISGPFIIKVDAQGAELDVLEGAKTTMLASEVIVLEVSLFAFMSSAPEFYDVIHYMHGHGFAAYDIILNWNRPLDNALGQIDIVFVKENGLFRKTHHYSAIDPKN